MFRVWGLGFRVSLQGLPGLYGTPVLAFFHFLCHRGGVSTSKKAKSAVSSKALVISHNLFFNPSDSTSAAVWKPPAPRPNTVMYSRIQ